MHCLGSDGVRQNSADLTEFGRNSRLWQIAVENGRLRWNLWQIVVEIGGHVQGVTGVSRGCPVIEMILENLAKIYIKEVFI